MIRKTTFMSPWRLEVTLNQQFVDAVEKAGKTKNRALEEAVACWLAVRGLKEVAFPEGFSLEGVAALKPVGVGGKSAEQKAAEEEERKRLLHEANEECKREQIAQHEARCREWAEKKEREQREAFLAEEKMRLERGEDIV